MALLLSLLALAFCLLVLIKKQIALKRQFAEREREREMATEQSQGRNGSKIKSQMLARCQNQLNTSGSAN